jgi:hypothetical protein
VNLVQVIGGRLGAECCECCEESVE